MTETPGYGVRVAIALTARSRERVREVLERLGGEAAEWLWVPTVVDEQGGELVLDYAYEPSPSMPLADALPRFQQAAAVHVAEMLGLARYLAVCADVLARVEVPAPLAPACVRYAPERAGAWRLVVVPLVDVALADWAAASPNAWAWTPPNALLGKPAPNAGAYAIGAALTTLLCGDAVPPHATRGARFDRALRGWIGRPAQLAGAIRAALPASFTDEAAALTALIPLLCDGAPPSDWDDRLRHISEQLAPRRLAARWEYEGRLDVARGILERYAATTPRQHVPWDVIARVRESSHDADGALEAAIAALDTPDTEGAVRDLAAVARRLVAALPAARSKPLLERAVAAVDRLGARVGDLGRLHVAHLEARYLEHFPSALARLAQPAAESWDNVVRDTLLARIHAARAEWAHVARLCKQARAAATAMPEHGGALGAYVVAYLDYLDGVAHHGAVRVYDDSGYLADAYARLAAAIDGGIATCEPGDPLVASAVDWMYAVAELAEARGVPDAPAIRAGVLAYLGAQGLTRRTAEPYRRELPPIAWYDAGRVLALSGASST